MLGMPVAEVWKILKHRDDTIYVTYRTLKNFIVTTELYYSIVRVLALGDLNRRPDFFCQTGGAAEHISKNHYISKKNCFFANFWSRI